MTAILLDTPAWVWSFPLNAYLLLAVPVRSAMRQRDMIGTALTRRPGLDASVVRRLPAPGRRSHIGRIGKAPRSVSRRLAVRNRAA